MMTPPAPGIQRDAPWPLRRSHLLIEAGVARGEDVYRFREGAGQQPGMHG